MLGERVIEYENSWKKSEWLRSDCFLLMVAQVVISYSVKDIAELLATV